MGRNLTDVNGKRRPGTAGSLTDINDNEIWDPAETFTDSNGNEVYDGPEEFTDDNLTASGTPASFQRSQRNCIRDAEIYVDATATGTGRRRTVHGL